MGWELPASVWEGVMGDPRPEPCGGRALRASGQHSWEHDIGKTSRSSLNTDNRSWRCEGTEVTPPGAWGAAGWDSQPHKEGRDGITSLLGKRSDGNDSLPGKRGLGITVSQGWERQHSKPREGQLGCPTPGSAQDSLWAHHPGLSPVCASTVTNIEGNTFSDLTFPKNT